MTGTGEFTANREHLIRIGVLRPRTSEVTQTPPLDGVGVLRLDEAGRQAAAERVARGGEDIGFYKQLGGG